LEQIKKVLLNPSHKFSLGLASLWKSNQLSCAETKLMETVVMGLKLKINRVDQ
jgi:hypothetical protein